MSDKKDGETPGQALLIQAEAKFAAAKKATPATVLSFDELMQELHGHQAELGKQNEELRHTQATLEKAKAHYVDLYDYAPVGYLTLNDEGIMLEINLFAAKLLGENRADIIGRRFAKFVADDYKDLWRRHFQLAKQADSKYGCELPFMDDDGKNLYYHLDCLFEANGEATPTIRVTLTDVTERKQAEVGLRIAAAAFENQEGMFVADPDHIIQRTNKAFTRITGYSAEEVVGRTPCFLRSDLHDEGFYDDQWEAIRQFGYWQGEIWDKRKNGEVFPIWLTLAAVRDADGKTTHYVGAFSDITEKKQAEESLRIAAAAFKAQESILVTDANRVILRVNEAFTRITGYSAEEAIGNTPRILRSGFHDKAFYDAILEVVAREGYWEGEIWNKRKNGEIFPVLQTITAVTNDVGQLTHYVGAMMDISVQKQAEKVLLEARERLENQVATTQEELDAIKSETQEVNTALNVLIKHREKDKLEAQISLSNEVEAIVLPLLTKLKGASKNRLPSLRMISMVEDNLKNLMKSYGRTNHIDSVYQKLSPIERQVAGMVKLGQPTKVIAATLNITAGTVNIHRKHIRKKLGLVDKENLQGYLQSLTDSN